MMEEYAIYLLPHLLRQPIRKGRTRNSTKEVADAFVQVLPVSLKFIFSFYFTSGTWIEYSGPGKFVCQFCHQSWSPVCVRV